MRDYGKVHSSFWSSETMRSLSDDGRMLALYLMTCSHNTIAGVFRLPDGYACEDLQWVPQRVIEGFAELLEKGFANRCETTKWVWICKHLDWNAPENPNQWKAARKIANQVPVNCSWIVDFLDVFAVSSGEKQPENRNPSGTLQQPFLNQEQEQEQEQEQDKTHVDGKPSTPVCPHQTIIDLYHQHCPALPKVKIWNAERQKILKSRWREDPKHQTLAFWEKYFRYVATSQFLLGADGAWQADLEWLVRPANFAKVIEGKYHRERGVS